jgi:hypothetical protein
MAELNLAPLDNRDLIYDTGIRQERSFGRATDSLSGEINRRRDEKRQNQLIALNALGKVNIQSVASAKVMQQQNDMIEQFESKWSERWKSRRGLSNNDLVELTLDQKNIERAQAEMLVNDKVFSTAADAIKSDTKGMYDKGAWIKNAMDYIQNGNINMNSDTGMPMLDYAEIDMDSWLNNTRGEYRGKNRRMTSETYDEKGGEGISTKIYGFGSEEDVEGYLAGKMLEDPRVLKTIRKRSLESGMDFTGITTPSMTFLRAYTSDYKDFLSQESVPIEKRLPERKEKEEEQSPFVKTEPIVDVIGTKSPFKVEAENTIGLKQARSIDITPGIGAIDRATNRELSTRDALDFTPQTIGDYYVLKKKVGDFPKGSIITKQDIKKGTRFKPGDYEKKTMVKGTYKTKGKMDGVDEYGVPKSEIKTGTTYVPYENIKPVMESNIKGLDKEMESRGSEKSSDKIKISW